MCYCCATEKKEKPSTSPGTERHVWILDPLPSQYQYFAEREILWKIPRRKERKNTFLLLYTSLQLPTQLQKQHKMSNPPGFVSYKSSKTVMAETVGGVVVLLVFFYYYWRERKKRQVVGTSSITTRRGRESATCCCCCCCCCLYYYDYCAWVAVLCSLLLFLCVCVFSSLNGLYLFLFVVFRHRCTNLLFYTQVYQFINGALYGAVWGLVRPNITPIEYPTFLFIIQTHTQLNNFFL